MLLCVGDSSFEPNKVCERFALARNLEKRNLERKLIFACFMKHTSKLDLRYLKIQNFIFKAINLILYCRMPL